MEAMKFHEKLGMLAAKKGVKKVDIARAIGVSNDTVGRWFKAGESYPDLKEGLTIARMLETSLDYLADDSLDDPALAEKDPRAAFILEAAMRLGFERASTRLLGVDPELVEAHRGHTNEAMVKALGFDGNPGEITEAREIIANLKEKKELLDFFLEELRRTHTAADVPVEPKKKRKGVS